VGVRLSGRAIICIALSVVALLVVWASAPAEAAEGTSALVQPSGSFTPSVTDPDPPAPYSALRGVCHRPPLCGRRSPAGVARAVMTAICIQYATGYSAAHQ
jgi:hypothetical protein